MRERELGRERVRERERERELGRERERVAQKVINMKHLNMKYNLISSHLFFPKSDICYLSFC